MGKQPKQFHATIDRNGTEDEITIRTPKGRPMAFIWFWDDEHGESSEAAKRAKRDALKIVTALNLFRNIKNQTPEKSDMAAHLMVKALPKLYAALEKCEEALANYITRCEIDRRHPSEFESSARAEAFEALCIARGEIPF